MTDDDPPDAAEDETAPDAEPIASAVDPKEFSERRKRIDLEAEQIRLFWSRIMRNPIGARVVWQILTELHAFDERFACGPNGFPQPEATWFEAGKQSYGLALYQKLAVYDREALFALHDLYDPRFAKPKPSRRRRP